MYAAILPHHRHSRPFSVRAAKSCYGIRMNELTHIYAAIAGMTLLIVVLLVWSLIWKGVGLWFAARNYQKAWFVAILVLNTAGILEIIYLLFFRRDKQPVTKSLFEKPVAGPEDDEPVAQTPSA